MWRITWKGMWSHKRRLLGTTMAVVLGVAFLAGTLVLGDTMTAGFDDLFSEANAGTDVVVRNADRDRQRRQRRPRLPSTPSSSTRSPRIDGVVAAVPIIEGSGRIVGADGSTDRRRRPPDHGDQLGRRLDRQPVATSPKAGRRATSPRATRTRSSSTAPAPTHGDLHVGDHTVVQMPEPIDVTIVGIATFGGADSSGPTTYTAFTDDAAAELVGRSRARSSSIRVAATDGVSQDELRGDIAADAAGRRIEAITGAELTDEMMADIEGDFLGMFKTILLAFAVIALVVASFSIHNTFSILDRPAQPRVGAAAGARRIAPPGR